MFCCYFEDIDPFEGKCFKTAFEKLKIQERFILHLWAQMPRMVLSTDNVVSVEELKAE